MNIFLVDSKDPIKIQANDNKCFTFLKAFFGLNLCCTIIKFNFHFGNKLVSLEIRQVKERRRGGGETTNTEKSPLSSTRGRTKHHGSSFRQNDETRATSIFSFDGFALG